MVTLLEDDTDSIKESAEEILAESLAVLESASEGESEEDESDPDVLFRFMSAVNTLYAGQNEESIPAFDLIIRIHPEMPRAYYYRGVAFYRSEQHELAQGRFREIAGARPRVGGHLSPARSAQL